MNDYAATCSPSSPFFAHLYDTVEVQAEWPPLPGRPAVQIGTAWSQGAAVPYQVVKWEASLPAGFIPEGPAAARRGGLLLEFHGVDNSVPLFHVVQRLTRGYPTRGYPTPREALNAVLPQQSAYPITG